ncbi:hypothetical protein H632_c3107p0 [Helicosporidium sp. ATCC 50920]|nr:hypothetical protein H632_c3107p0 [Helicosporidium sp. ATCC 50920]|eukprot:KDD72628.1 hypothetical protein H632_c3107p0 [Helicosporidium sp. ATCC 50920]
MLLMPRHPRWHHAEISARRQIWFLRCQALSALAALPGVQRGICSCYRIFGTMTGVPVPPESRERAEDDDLLLVPRLVARIADLERQLFARQQHDEAAQAGTVSGRALALFKSAQRRIDAGVAYMCAGW